MSFKVVQVINTAISGVGHRPKRGEERKLSILRPLKASTELEKLRRQFSVAILTVEIMAGGSLLGIILTFLFSFLRRRTWLLFAVLNVAGAISVHLAIVLMPSAAKPRNKYGHRPSSSSAAASPSSTRRGSRPRMFSAWKISPASTRLVDAGKMLGNPVAILVGSELEKAKNMKNRDDIFVPPTEQPCAKHLKMAATLLHNNMFLQGGGEKTMNDSIGVVIEEVFVPVARAHFDACIQQAQNMVPEMRLRYQSVRQGHLAIYNDTLNQIRRENTFPGLQKRSQNAAGPWVGRAYKRLEACVTCTAVLKRCEVGTSY